MLEDEGLRIRKSGDPRSPGPPTLYESLTGLQNNKLKEREVRAQKSACKSRNEMRREGSIGQWEAGRQGLSGDGLNVFTDSQAI